MKIGVLKTTLKKKKKTWIKSTGENRPKEGRVYYGDDVNASGAEGRGRRRRGRPNGTTFERKGKQKETQSENHIKASEVFCMAQSWITVYQRQMWKAIEKMCNERFKMTRSANSLQAKYNTF